MYIPGDYYLLCDICGFKIRRSEARKTWDNLMVCSKDWEPRHPQEFVRAIQERNNALDARPEGTDIYVAERCSMAQTSSVAGTAVAGCMVAGRRLAAS